MPLLYTCVVCWYISSCMHGRYLAIKFTSNHKVQYTIMQEHYTLITVVWIPRFHPSYKYFVRKLKVPSESLFHAWLFHFQILERLGRAMNQLQLVKLPGAFQVCTACTPLNWVCMLSLLSLFPPLRSLLPFLTAMHAVILQCLFLSCTCLCNNSKWCLAPGGDASWRTPSIQNVFVNTCCLLLCQLMQCMVQLKII